MRFAWCLVAVLLTACTPAATASAPPTTTPERLTPTAPSTEHPALLGGRQDAVPGPGGMTLRQEIGAVMMVGFQGPFTPAVLNDWRQRQYGGLIVVPTNQNAHDPDAIHALIAAVRSVMAHPLLAATNQEGASVPEMPMASQKLKALGFDIYLAPVADAAGAQDVAAAIAGIHAAGMYAAAQVAGADVTPFRAAIAAHVDLAMIGHLNVAAPGASVSASLIRALHSGLGYQGVVISNDLETDAVSPQTLPPAAAVRFLENGGDMVIIAHHLDVADATYDAIHAALLSGAYPRAQLDASVQKLLTLGLRFMP